MKNYYVLVIMILMSCSFKKLICELLSGRIKGDDEPKIVSWRVLEGITEPFQSAQSGGPLWKQMKASADQKAANMAIQQALHEYGQLLRHPYLFGEMPNEDRYDVFLSMAKLLKIMGFDQRAELILYEAMAYSKNAFEAHYQLGLIYLEREELEKSKMHLKNCLYYEESDVSILVYLTSILLAEGKLHEAKFFLGRVIYGFEQRKQKLSSILGESISESAKLPDYRSLTNWLEDILWRVFYGEFTLKTTSTLDQLRFFNALQHAISVGEITGRYIFDLGQTLYEGGRPSLGIDMMKRGHATADIVTEGEVSLTVIELRIALEYPTVPESLFDVVSSYLSMTSFLARTSANYSLLHLENIQDLYWPLPLLFFSALPITAVLNEVLWRFSPLDLRSEGASSRISWLNPHQHNFIIDSYLSQKINLQKVELSNSFFTQNSDIYHYEDLVDETLTPVKTKQSKTTSYLIPPTPSEYNAVVQIGIIGGHMNAHPVGHTFLRRILSIIDEPSRESISNSNGCIGYRKWREILSFTLIAPPTISDSVTRRIANRVNRIVNIPADTAAALKVLKSLEIDILLFPDWAPFPDTQSLLHMSLRIAPVQICIFIRGSSCVASHIDYYLLPSEIEDFYLKMIPAAASNATISKATQVSTLSGNNMSSRPLRYKWKEIFSEQVILLDWPLITTTSIENQISAAQLDGATSSYRRGQNSGTSTTSSSPSYSDQGPLLLSEDAMLFSPLDAEGRVFFDGQPVAVLPYSPEYVHPLMDDVILKLLRAVPELQLILFTSEALALYDKTPKHSQAWTKRLVRRLWMRGGNLSHRIRLLPYPLSERRILSLLRQADVVLDSFPIGASPYFLSLALAVGIPILTFRPGTPMKSSSEQLTEIRASIQQSAQSHPMIGYLLKNDIPWLSAVSSVAGFYGRVGLASELVADNIISYFSLTVKLLTDREKLYDLRVRLLDALDFDANHGDMSSKASDIDLTAKNKSNKTTSKEKYHKEYLCPDDDLGRFLRAIGIPWAQAREKTENVSRDKSRINRDKDTKKRNDGFLKDFDLAGIQ